MPKGSLRARWQFLTHLPCKFGWVAELRIIDIDVLCDDRFNSAADAVRRLPLLHPDWLQQIVDVAWLVISGIVSLPILA